MTVLHSATSATLHSTKGVSRSNSNTYVMAKSSAHSVLITSRDGGVTRCRMLVERGTPHRHPEQLPGLRRDEWAEGHPPGPWEV